MTEIRVDVDVPHPPERVWRALTDPQVFGQWFLPADLRAVPGARFTIDPSGTAGFDDEPIQAEVVEAEPPVRLVMRWRASQLQTVVALSIRRLDDGSRLSLEQHGFVGPRGTLRRRVLQRAYSRMLAEPLSAALCQLEDAERTRAALARRRGGSLRPAVGSSRRNDARSFPRIPRQAGDAAAPPGERGTARHGGTTLSGPGRPRGAVRRPWETAGGPAQSADEAAKAVPPPTDVRTPRTTPRASRSSARAPAPLLAGTALLLVVAVVATVLAQVTAPQPHATAGRSGSPSTGPSTGGAGAAGGTARIGGVPTDGSPNVSAAYRTGRTFVGGYHGSITINNLSSVPLQGWAAEVTLSPLGLIVQDVRGAQYQQTGKDVRFTPAAGNEIVRPGTSIEVTFQVQGAGAPVRCTVNGQPCSGLPG